MVEVRIEFIRPERDPQTAQANLEAKTMAERIRERLANRTCPLGHTKPSYIVVVATKHGASQVDKLGTCCSVFANQLDPLVSKK